MIPYLGDFLPGQTVRHMWNSNAVAGESITRSTNGTISVYKDGGTTQFTTNVTDTEDFDTLTGVHFVSIDTNNSAYGPGEYHVVLSAATIDGKTINAGLFSFSIANRSNATIISRGVAVATNSTTTATQLAAAETFANDILNGGLLTFIHGTGRGQSMSITDYANTNDIATHPAITTAADGTTYYEVVPFGLTDNSQSVNVTKWLGTACATPTVAGVPEVDVTHFGGTAATTSSGRPEVNTTHAAGTAWGSGAITAASIASDAIAAAKIASGAITSAKFAAGAIDAAAIATGAIDADALAADAGTEIAAAVVAHADFVALDDKADAIKAKTDSLTYTVAGVVDANIQRINDVAITGDGSGTPFNV